MGGCAGDCHNVVEWGDADERGVVNEGGDGEGEGRDGERDKSATLARAERRLK